LKEKAKTSYSICEQAYLTCEACKHQGKCGSGGCPLLNVLWVRLEDAEQALLDRLTPLEQEVSILQKERLELKQKLRLLKHQLLDFLDTLYYPHKIPDGLQNFIQEKFEGLLKEAKP
jgi:hypothetical protein